MALRVLHIRDTGRLGGPGKTILETVRLNRDEDVEYQVAAFGPVRENPFLTQLAGHCRTHGLADGPLAFAGLPRTVSRLVRRERIDLLHAHDFKTDLLAALVGPATGVPAVTTVHGYIAVDWKSELRCELDRRVLRRMDRVVAVSEAMRRSFLEIGIEPDRIRLIRNCITLENYPFRSRSGIIRRELGLRETCPIIGHVGRLSPEKGQRRLLRVMPDVRRHVPDVHLVFAGSGPDHEELRRRAAARGLQDRVHFLGYRDDIPVVMSDLDLLVLSSDTEGLPNVVLEAMALGVPVVATAVGGTPEVVEQAVTGLLVSPTDEPGLVRSIVACLRDHAGAERRAMTARRRLEERFAMANLIERTHAMYRELAAERRS